MLIRDWLLITNKTKRISKVVDRQEVLVFLQLLYFLWGCSQLNSKHTKLITPKILGLCSNFLKIPQPSPDFFHYLDQFQSTTVDSTLTNLACTTFQEPNKWIFDDDRKTRAPRNETYLRNDSLTWGLNATILCITSAERNPSGFVSGWVSPGCRLHEIGDKFSQPPGGGVP